MASRTTPTDSDISHVCFVGVYGHNQNDVLREGLSQRDVTLSEITVEKRTFEQARKEWRPPILTVKATLRWLSRFPSVLFPVLFVGVFLIHGILTWAAILQQLPTVRDADVLVVPHMGDTSVLLVKPLSLILDTPLIYFSHNGLYFPHVRNQQLHAPGSLGARLLFGLDWLMHRLADRVIVFSAASGTLFSDTFDVPAERYKVIYIAVTESKFNTATSASELSVPDVLYWGNFLPHHGVKTMIEAAAALPETEFMFIGDSEHRPAFIEHADRLGATNIEFPGFVPFPVLVWAITEADVVLGPMGDNPQTEFTVGTKVAEAAYLQKAIVVADQPGIREVFADRMDAALVSPGSTDGLVEAIEEILSDDELKHRLECGAYETYEAHFSQDVAVDRFLSVAEEFT